MILNSRSPSDAGTCDPNPGLVSTLYSPSLLNLEKESCRFGVSDRTFAFMVPGQIVDLMGGNMLVVIEDKID